MWSYFVSFARIDHQYIQRTDATSSNQQFQMLEFSLKLVYLIGSVRSLMKEIIMYYVLWNEKLPVAVIECVYINPRSAPYRLSMLSRATRRKTLLKQTNNWERKHWAAAMLEKLLYFLHSHIFAWVLIWSIFENWMNMDLEITKLRICLKRLQTQSGIYSRGSNLEYW